MCNFWSCCVDKHGKVYWDGNITSHEELVKKFHLKDDKLEDRDFVRIEITPKKFTMFKKDWKFKVDEEGTLPEWFRKGRKHLEEKCWRTLFAHMKDKKLYLIQPEIDAEVKRIKAIPFFSMKGEVRKEWHISFGKNWSAAESAAGSAAESAAESAAWSAAESAAWSAAESAAWSAARSAAWSAARSAARSAAWSAAWSAAESAARSAAWSAARSAALSCQIRICLKLGVKIDAKHVQHAADRMAVWEAGYGLVTDVGGRLYVYGVKK